jgi:hypothetical protein
MSGPPEPAGEERLGCAGVDILPELAEALFQRPGPRHFEVPVLQRAEHSPLVRGHLRGAHKPEILRSGQSVIARLLEGPMLSASDPVHRLVEMFGHMELIKDDLGVGVLHST